MGKAARHLLSEEERKRVPQVHDLWVDIGARDEEDAAGVVQIGDPVVMGVEPIELRGLRLASRALDNRLGALVVLEAARRAAAAGDLKRGGDRRRLGARGDVVRGRSHRRLLARARRRDHARRDAHRRLPQRRSGARDRLARARLGADRSRAAPPSTKASRTASSRSRARRASRTRWRPTARASWTDSEAVQEVRAGVPCGLVGIPLRYMHSPSETCDLRDVELAIDLVARFCRSLQPGEDWNQ